MYLVRGWGPWSRGYDVALTKRRSQVQFLPDPPSTQLGQARHHDMVEEIAGLASRIGRRLKKRGWSISVAESCTGGLICSTFTDISGSSAWFKQGWVVYSNESKISEVDVSPNAFDLGERGRSPTKSLCKWHMEPGTMQGQK